MLGRRTPRRENIRTGRTFFCRCRRPQKDNEEDVRRGFDPRDDIEFCSYLAPTFSRDEIMDGGVDADRCGHSCYSPDPGMSCSIIFVEYSGVVCELVEQEGCSDEIRAVLVSPDISTQVFHVSRFLTLMPLR